MALIENLKERDLALTLYKSNVQSGHFITQVAEQKTP